MKRFSAEDAAKWSRGEWIPSAPSGIPGVSIDSRRLSPGELFLALKGPRFDGHDFVESAFENGASGAVVRRDALSRLSQAGPRPLLAVEDTTAALAAMAAGYRRAVAPTVIAVTGSAGKTTVKEMLADVLSSAVPTARTRGNWNNEIGIPLSLLSMEPGTRVGVFEVGVSHPGEMAPLCRLLQPAWAVVTAIGPAHLEFFGSVESIAREKADLLRSLRADGVAVLDRDEEWFPLLRSAAPGAVISVSVGGDADYVCQHSEDGDDGTATARLWEKSTGQTVTLRLPLPGRHVVRNALLVAAAARGQGVEWSAICDALWRYRSLPMRWERLSVAGAIVIHDAYNANPASMRASIDAFHRLKATGRKWLVLGGMLELGPAAESEHLALGREIGEAGWAHLVTVGGLAAWISDGAEAAGLRASRVVRCADSAAASRVLRERTAPGDAIFLKASRGIRLEECLEGWRRQAEGEGYPRSSREAIDPKEGAPRHAPAAAAPPTAS